MEDLMNNFLSGFSFFAGGFALSVGVLDFTQGNFKMGVVLLVLAGLNFHSALNR